MKHTIIQKAGFTLIESLVAVAMLTLVITTVMGLAQSSISANTQAQVQISANYLAGEAIEYIRNIRDQNFINPNPSFPWYGNIPTECFADGCDVDTVNNSFFIECDAGGCDPLKFTDSVSTGFYHHSNGSGTDSIFKRKVKIAQVTNNGTNSSGVSNEIRIEVTITSDFGYFKQTPLVVVEHLYNWFIPS